MAALKDKLAIKEMEMGEDSTDILVLSSRRSCIFMN